LLAVVLVLAPDHRRIHDEELGTGLVRKELLPHLPASSSALGHGIDGRSCPHLDLPSPDREERRLAGNNEIVSRPMSAFHQSSELSDGLAETRLVSHKERPRPLTPAGSSALVGALAHGFAHLGGDSVGSAQTLVAP